MIKVLDQETINKIAAGEVIERPASVVKELVENALDAGATRIEVELQNGGKTRILVNDDGCGMSKEEMLLAVQRHATSKISSAEDLFAIKTMGFRGEALPSIAAVSKLSILSKPKNSPAADPGTELLLEGGRIVHTLAAPAREGTTICVEELFYNVPARLKFIKKDVTELGQIINLFSKFIIGGPQTAFLLKANDKVILQSPGAKHLDQSAYLAAATVVLGSKIAKKMRPFAFDSAFLRVQGLLASPDETKADRAGQYFYVNGRAVFNPALSKALQEGLRDRVPRGRYPIGIFFLEVDPQEVDVNVHPTKREVKFLRQSDVYTGILQAVRQTYTKLEDSLKAVEVVSRDPFIRMHSQHARVTTEDIGQQGALLDKDELRTMVQIQASAIESSYAQSREHLFPVAQINKTYIAALDGEDLVLIDQHVAHERVLYEQLKEQYKHKRQDIQELLIPESIELSPEQFNSLESSKEFLMNAGFRFEDFGERTILLRGVPQSLIKVSGKQLFLDILDEFKASELPTQKEIKEEEMLKMIACKAALKAGELLTIQEIKKLLNDLERTSNPQTCPHGRPIIVPITKDELDKKFGRA